jgi:antiviral helicase SKI2
MTATRLNLQTRINTPQQPNPTTYKMAELASALENLQLSAADTADDWIDNILEEQQRPRKRIKQDPEELKRELEKKYLTPSKSFSPEWLNKLQQ